MRTDLQQVITRLSASKVSFDREVAAMKIEMGSTDDESLLLLSNAANAILYELQTKIESSKLIASLKNYRPAAISTKQEMVTALKKEIRILANQAENL